VSGSKGKGLAVSMLCLPTSHLGLKRLRDTCSNIIRSCSRRWNATFRAAGSIHLCSSFVFRGGSPTLLQQAKASQHSQEGLAHMAV